MHQWSLLSHQQTARKSRSGCVVVGALVGWNDAMMSFVGVAVLEIKAFPLISHCNAVILYSESEDTLVRVGR
jgi:hypothetical protein